MTKFGVVLVLLTFTGGCASSGPKPGAEVPTFAALPALVVDAKQLPAVRSPSGTATSTALAQGHNAFLALMRLEPGAKIPAHQDESEEYLYVLEGGGEITIDGGVSTIGPGTAVFMPSMATVSYENGPSPSVVVQVFADPRSAAKYKAWKPVTEK